MFGQGGDRLRRDAGVSLGLGDDEKKRLGGRFYERHGFRYRPQIGRGGPHRDQDQIGKGQDSNVLLRNRGGRIDEAIGRALSSTFQATGRGVRTAHPRAAAFRSRAVHAKGLTCLAYRCRSARPGTSPARSASTARWAARVVLPLPPFCEVISIVFIKITFIHIGKQYFMKLTKLLIMSRHTRYTVAVIN